MENSIELRPFHIACVSGGKDSLYMLSYILQHQDKYPVDMVVHYELEIDWPWVNDVVNIMDSMCTLAGIPFQRIKPRKTWNELYNKYYFPTRMVRWCNSKYKLDCNYQLEEMVRKMNCRIVYYIGFCADEQNRFKYDIGKWNDPKCRYCYPLAEEGITEDTVLDWAKCQPILSHWYKLFKRQGCMYCPMITRLEMAFMLKYYPDDYNKYITFANDWEIRMDNLKPEKAPHKYWGRYSAYDIDIIIHTKWLNKLNKKECGVS